MRLADIHNVAVCKAKAEHLCWGGDNRALVEHVLHMIPDMDTDIRQVILWAYGFGDSPCSFEGMSDGSTVVDDVFMGGLIKEPYGVAHDMIFMLHHIGLPTPDGHVWTWWQSNRFYRRAMRVLSPTFSMRASLRWFGLTVGSIFVWRHSRDDLSKKMKAMRNETDEVKIAFLKEQAKLSFGR